MTKKDKDLISEAYIRLHENDPKCSFCIFRQEWEKIGKLISTILEKQVNEGKWIDREEYDADRWKCSECGRTEQYQENFCPYCGAKMKSEE